MLDFRHGFHWELEFPIIFGRGIKGLMSLLVIPILRRAKIGGELGKNFLKYLKLRYSPSDGIADLSSYFLRIGFELIKKWGSLVSLRLTP